MYKLYLQALVIGVGLNRTVKDMIKTVLATKVTFSPHPPSYNKIDIIKFEIIED